MAGLIGAQVMVAWTAVHGSEARNWVEHTLIVERELASLQAALIEAGVPAKPSRGEDEVGTILKRLGALTADNPSQQTRVGRLTRGVAPGDALGILDEMRADESALLRERSARAERLKNGVLLLQALMTLVAVGVAGSILWSSLRLARVRKLDADRLREANTFLDAVLENIPNMLFVKDAKELRFHRFNRAGEALLGMPRGQLLGKNDFDLFPEDQARNFRAKDRAVLGGIAKLDIPEEPIKTASGQTRWLHTQKVPLLDGAGAPAFLLGISEDITERKFAADALAAATTRAEAVNAELEAFSYSVSHDLRAPLRGIVGFSQALVEDFGDQLPAGATDHLGRIRAAAERMAQLIDDLLRLSRLTRAPLRKSDVDVSRVVSEVVETLRASEPARAVEVEVQAGLTAAADGALVRVMVENLLGNAWKFTTRTAGAHIEVGKMRQGEEEVFFVRDNGAGFDMAHSTKLFGAFQRLHSAAEFSGTGIGLATAQRVVHRHGGRIWAQAVPAHGATFFWTLP